MNTKHDTPDVLNDINLAPVNNTYHITNQNQMNSLCTPYDKYSTLPNVNVTLVTLLAGVYAIDTVACNQYITYIPNPTYVVMFILLAL